jgi:hypothetical protein
MMSEVFGPRADHAILVQYGSDATNSCSNCGNGIAVPPPESPPDIQLYRWRGSWPLRSGSGAELSQHLMIWSAPIAALVMTE